MASPDLAPARPGTRAERPTAVTASASCGALVEGVHFRLDWTGFRELGYRAAAVNLSDLAASGAEPLALLVTLAAPVELELAAVLELYEGLNEPGVPIVGGDTTSAPQLTLAVTAVGRSERVPGRPERARDDD